MTPAPAQTGSGSPLDLILTGGSVVGLGDGPLLDRMTSGDAPAAGVALDALIRRHGSLVARVCRGILGDAQLAEDATQAVFLVLIRRAGSIRDPDRLASWLHGVALRTARAARRQRRGEPTTTLPSDETPMIDPTPDPAQTLIRREQTEILHKAIHRLPRRYLDPVVLCDLAGLTHAEAAQRLDCPPSTVGVRLKRAREKLRAKLSRHRLDFEAALPPAVAAGSIPRTLAATPAAHFLANRVAGALAAAKWQALAVVLLLVGVGTVGVRASYQTPAPAVPPVTDPPSRQDPPQARATPQPTPTDYPAWIKLGVPEVREVRESSETFAGKVVASRTVAIGSRTTDIITKIEVGEGDLVQRGQILFEIGSPERRSGFDVIQQQRRQATLERLQKVERAALSDDPAAIRLKQELAAIDQELERFIKSHPPDRVVAPFAGQVTEVHVAVGQAVEAGRTPLAEIVMVDPIQVDFQVDERN